MNKWEVDECSIEEGVFILLLLVQCLAVVDTVLDAEDGVQPHTDDGHEGVFVLVAEELRTRHLHVLLIQHSLHYSQLMSFYQLLGIGFLALVGRAGHLCGYVLQNLAEQIDQFLPALQEGRTETKQDAEVFLVSQHQLPQLPLLLFHQVRVAVDGLHSPTVADGGEWLVAGWEGSVGELESGLLEHVLHELKVVVDEVLLEAGPAAEVEVALLHALLLLIEHQVGLPAGLIFKVQIVFCKSGGDWGGWVSEGDSGGCELFHSSKEWMEMIIYYSNSIECLANRPLSPFNFDQPNNSHLDPQSINLSVSLWGRLVFLLLLIQVMLSQFYNRRTSLEPPRKEEPSKQEEDIINSFYEERKSRSAQNVKQHNLLRKNISYFQKDQEHSPPRQLPNSSFLNKATPQSTQSHLPPTTPVHAHLSKPPMPRPLPADHPKNIKPTSQGVPPLPLKELSHNPSQVSSNFSSLHLSKTGSQQQDFKAHLKNELNRRINIKHYLSEISEDNKQNGPKVTHATANIEKHSQLKLKYNYDSTVPQRLPSENISEQFSRISFQNSAEEQPMQQSRQSSISSLLQHDPSQNNFQFSRNSLTDRIQPNNQRDPSSNYRRSVPTLGDSRNHSDDGSKKTEKDSAGRNRESGSQNVLTGDQLSQLQQNSHPIREEGTESQPTMQKHVLNYFQPQVHAEYKRKIGDLERELESLKTQRKREDKFIHSIQKMRMLMDGTQEQCSLKELWRWIKTLPQKK